MNDWCFLSSTVTVPKTNIKHRYHTSNFLISAIEILHISVLTSQRCNVVTRPITYAIYANCRSTNVYSRPLVDDAVLDLVSVLEVPTLFRQARRLACLLRTASSFNPCNPQLHRNRSEEASARGARVSFCVSFSSWRRRWRLRP